MSEAPDPVAPQDPEPTQATGYHSRSERRSTRREAQRKRTASRFLWVAAPVLAVVVVIAALFAFVVAPSADHATSGVSSTITSLAETASEGSGLLVIEQNGTAVEAALIHGGPRGGVVLAVPGVTLLQSGDRFVRVSELHESENPTLLAALADILTVSPEAVVSVEWSELRRSLTETGIDPLPSEMLDASGEDAAEVAMALAAFVRESVPSGGEPDWEAMTLRGDVGGFRQALRAAVQAVLGESQGRAWVGNALPGRVSSDGGLTYLEPDVDRARSILGLTKTGN